ncbi:MAG TPA: metal-sensitive transcriptional regulator [Acidimicrobiia bacterium]|jgi:DNA-binding FrmR family transcriptional regulator|nr:metal-sensitive transcriptional regulator [Acidimicrobiia bacterium]
MQLDDATIADVMPRLHRIEGQVAGIARMVEGNRECRDVVQQIAAASKALDRVAYKLLAAHLKSCLLDEESAAASGYTPQELEKLFMTLA